MNRIFLFLLATILFSFQYSCTQVKHENKAKGPTPYIPGIKKVFDLPKDLHEISGISFIDSVNLVAIQDEEGYIYYYNITQQKVIGKEKFASPGDYEDVTVAGNNIYVVDSNGKLFEIKDFKLKKNTIAEITTPFTGKNNLEGLTYDAANNRLLIAPKNEGLDNKKKKIKEIYELNLQNGKMNNTPSYKIKLDEIENYFKGSELEESSKKFLKALGNENMNEIFRTSAIAIHPKTHEIYVLSSINNLIAILSSKGDLKRVMFLKGKEFIQPEGLAFTSDGRLFVSNEGRDKKANIIQLSYEN